MALVDNVLSQTMLNQTALPNLPSGPVTEGNNYIRRQDAFLTVPVADTTGSVYRFFRLPSNCRILTLDFSSTAMAGLTGLSIGAYYSNATATGLVVNAGADFMAITDVHLAQFKLNGYSAVMGVGTGSPANINELLWQVLGFTADPGAVNGAGPLAGMFDICALSTTQTGAAGTMSLSCSYLA